MPQNITVPGMIFIYFVWKWNGGGLVVLGDSVILYLWEFTKAFLFAAHTDLT